MLLANPTNLTVNLTGSTLQSDFSAIYTLNDPNVLPSFGHSSFDELISDENYQATLKFESHPFFQLGKHLREYADITFTSIVNSYHNIVDYFSAKPQSNHLDIDLATSPNLVHQAERIRQILLKKIKKGLQEANAKGKPLMILIGEDHEGYDSALVETAVALIAHDYLGVEEILSEPYKLSDEHRDTLKNKEKGPLPIVALNILIDMYPTMDIIPIDLALSDFVRLNYANYYNIKYKVSNYPQLQSVNEGTSRRGLEVRNEVMAKTILDQHTKHTVAIVGAGHLNDLMARKDLNDYYHILPLNTASLYCQEVNHAFMFCTDSQITQVKIHDANIHEKPAFTPLKIAKMARKAQELTQVKIMGKSIGKPSSKGGRSA